MFTLPILRTPCLSCRLSTMSGAVQGYHKNRPCVKLCVTLKYPMNHGEAIDSIQSYCKKNLAKFSCPRKIEIFDSLPRTKMAKVDFMALSDKYTPEG